MRALPPLVVSGLPNITPIFMRIWLMKITMQRDLEIEPVSLRKAWLISRAWLPICMSPISPSSSDFGVSAATEIDHEHVDGAGAHQRIGDLERLLAGVGLGDQEVLEVDPELPRIDGVERVLGVDEAANAAALLRLGDDMERERGLAGGFRAVNLDDAAARQAADAERDVEPERAGGNGLDLHRLLVLAETHDGALAAIPLDLRDRSLERLFPVHLTSFDNAKARIQHGQFSHIS